MSPAHACLLMLVTIRLLHRHRNREFMDKLHGPQPRRLALAAPRAGRQSAIMAGTVRLGPPRPAVAREEHMRQNSAPPPAAPTPPWLAAGATALIGVSVSARPQRPAPPCS